VALRLRAESGAGADAAGAVAAGADAADAAAGACAAESGAAPSEAAEVDGITDESAAGSVGSGPLQAARPAATAKGRI
jgi:hypothetical protein